MINKSYLTGFMSKFNFGKDLLENVKIEVNSKGNRVHCLTEDKSMYMDIHTKEDVFEKPFILPDIARFLKYLNVFDKEFDYEFDTEEGEAFSIQLFDEVTYFEYGLGEDILLINTKAPDSVTIDEEDVLITIDEKKANAILNSLKLTSSYFITIKVDKKGTFIRIGDEEIKEPVVEMILDGKVRTKVTGKEELSGRYSLNNFATILSVNKNCNVKIKFGKAKGCGMMIEAEDENYECIYAINSLVR